MPTPGTLGLLEAMADGSLADLEPRFDHETGTIDYPDAESYLPADASVVRTLDRLADRGLLEREFREKTHECPDCSRTELQYVTLCPECASPETTREVVLRHTECGYAAPRERFVETCPGCDMDFDANGEYVSACERHRCGACGWRFADPDGRLQCRRCSGVFEPTRAPETIWYRYRFDEARRDWLYTQLAARGAVGDVLDRRGFDVDWDEEVNGASGLTYLLDLYAIDTDRDLAVIAMTAEQPTAEDVIDLHATSIDVDAYPIVIATGERPADVALDLAEHLDVGMLHPTEPREPAVSADSGWLDSLR